MELQLVQREMIEEFQCPGCVAGMNTSCGVFKLKEDYGFYCESHVPGTRGINIGQVLLGLPKAFNRLGPLSGVDYNRIRLWIEKKPEFDKFNIPVWAMERDGYLLVRTYSPRINYPIVDVIKGGILADVPQALDVSKFIDEMD